MRHETFCDYELLLLEALFKLANKPDPDDRTCEFSTNVRRYHLQEVGHVQVFLVFGAEKMQHQENAQESQDIVAKCPLHLENCFKLYHDSFM